MNLIDFSKIKLDVNAFANVSDEVETHYNFNDGCILHPHWVKDSAKNFNTISISKEFESLSWMGDGFPNTTTYTYSNEDRFNLAYFFATSTLNSIDIQSGLYQFYAIDDVFSANIAKDRGVKIIEIGGGYGRLAIFFLLLFGKNCHYVNVDFVPTSLAFSPQIIGQLFPHLKVGGILDTSNNIEDYNYISLPAWNINKIKSKSYNLGVNIHSFQEMKNKSTKFYIKQLAKAISHSGYLYVINNPPELNDWYTEHDYYGFEKYFDDYITRKYPIGADWKKICGVNTLERIMIPKKTQ